LCADFRDDFCERLKLVKLCHKGDLDGDADGLLWHFTRFSILQKILATRQIWLSDLAHSNDENEVVYGVRRAKSVVDEISKPWSNRKHAETVVRLVKQAHRRFKTLSHSPQSTTPSSTGTDTAAACIHVLILTIRISLLALTPPHFSILSNCRPSNLPSTV
jgi:hypothetical protein